jgi:hypothetical protein
MNGTTTQREIVAFHRRSTAVMILMSSLKGALRSLPVIVGGLLVMSALDGWLEISPLPRQISWITITVAAVALFASGFFPLSMFLVKNKKLPL